MNSKEKIREDGDVLGKEKERKKYGSLTVDNREENKMEEADKGIQYGGVRQKWIKHQRGALLNYPLRRFSLRPFSNRGQFPLNGTIFYISSSIITTLVDGKFSSISHIKFGLYFHLSRQMNTRCPDKHLSGIPFAITFFLYQIISKLFDSSRKFPLLLFK